MSKNNQPWVGLGQLTDTETFNEQSKVEMPAHSLADQVGQADEVEMKSNRRDFLKMMGFGLGAATAAAACDIPRKYAVPYVTKPDSIVPGIAAYYASSFVSGNDFCPVLVKTREGRPIKIEGNSASGMLGLGTTARAQASVLSLYDTERISGPVRIARTDGEAGFKPTRTSWKDIDDTMSKLSSTAKVHIITNTIHSPSINASIAEFKTAYPNTSVVNYDTSTSSAAIQANAETFGKAVLPGYHFDKADVVVGIDCDFLGTWVFPSLYSSQYAKRRRVVNQLKPTMNRHYQVESTMTLTGSNADHRVRVKPSHIGQAIIELHNQVASLTGGSSAGSARVGADEQKVLATAAKDLVTAHGNALVVSGSNNVAEQKLVNAINAMLGAYGNTLDFARPTKLRQGLDKELQTSMAAMAAGNVDAVIFHGDVNPAFDYPLRDRFAASVAKVPIKVSLGGMFNETTALCDVVAPDHHLLESWGDAEPIGGVYTIIQPTIHPLWDTRQAGHSFLTWAKSSTLDASAEQPYLEFIRGVWKNATFPAQTRFASFDAFWDSALSEGVFVGGPTYSAEEMTGFSGSGSATGVRQPSAEGTLELAMYESVAVGHGQYAGNPWLQEVPDPVTRTTWGNYLQVPVTYSGGNNYAVFKDLNSDELKGKTDIVSVTSNGTESNTSCVIQFGMATDTVGIATGYGRTVIGKAGQGIGTNVYPWASVDADGNRQYYSTDVVVSEAIDEDPRFAIVQYHHTMGVTGKDEGESIVVDEERTLFGGYGGIADGYEGSLTERSIIRRANLNEVEPFVEKLVHEREHHQKLNSHSLYDGHDEAYKIGHHWGMFVDLNSCTGCSACVVACIAENNIPVVGKNEVARHHEMTWLRIDRYYYGDVDNPQVVYQPMMCQHCDNAPCENVCPVAATNHSSEGLNQMTYNRCIGTRYCANNCPYKVRRFNWMDYTTADIFIGNEPGLMEDDIVPVGGDGMPFGSDNLTRMVLNPDVTVRSRGVIEKCSFCVQRIQEGKLSSKREGRQLRDADVRTACQTSCPTGAITFGDRNNAEGDLMQVWNAPVNYLVLEEVNVAPSVMYSAKITNRNAELAALDTHVGGDHDGGHS